MRTLNTTPLIGRIDQVIAKELREHATQVNLLAQGRASAVLCLPSAPTSGAYAHGDIVRNSAPAEEGLTGSKFVVFGWLCVSGGDPATFVPMRMLTGN